jgi:hypothetical protein
MACELGKFPHEIIERMTMDDLLEFAGYLSLQHSKEPEKSVEETLIRALGEPE